MYFNSALRLYDLVQVHFQNAGTQYPFLIDFLNNFNLVLACFLLLIKLTHFVWQCRHYTRISIQVMQAKQMSYDKLPNRIFQVPDSSELDFTRMQLTLC